MKRGANKLPPSPEEIKANKIAALKVELFELQSEHEVLTARIKRPEFISPHQLRIFRKARGRVWNKIKEVKKQLQLLR